MSLLVSLAACAVDPSRSREGAAILVTPTTAGGTAGDAGAPPCARAAAVVLNEVVSANHTTLHDLDGETVDWIELYNADPEPVSLRGWALSDDPDAPAKWTLPDLSLAPAEHLLVHASGKDRTRIVGSWETRIGAGHEWRYLEVREPPDAGWALPDHDDGGWATGASGFGTGDQDDETYSDADTLYVRTRFELTADEAADVVALVLHVDFDDAFVAYLDGVEVARHALGLPSAGPPAWDAAASWPNEARLPTGGRPAWFDLEPFLGQLGAGTHTLALEVHDEAESTDLTLLPLLSLGFATPGEDRADPTLGLRDVDLHTNFSLRAEGEAVRLYDPAGCLADELDPGVSWADESYGRQPDGTGPLVWFVEPTPDGPNLTEGRPGFAPTPVFDPPAGFHAGGASVTLSAGPDARVHVARDGWEPTEADPVYEGPLDTRPDGHPIVLRARAWQEGLWPSRVATATYLAEEVGALPVVSLVTDPPNLWDDELGIYTIGADASPDYPWANANFKQKWERAVHVEQWEPGGAPGFTEDGSIAIHGGTTRLHEQKNLELKFGGGWGDAEVEHEVFPGLDVTSFDRLLLRAGGGDWLGCFGGGCNGGTMYRDPLTHALTVGADVDRMASRAVRVLLNGEYWGLYYLNEKSDRSYVEAHHDVDEIDMLRNEGLPRWGDETAWLELLDQLRGADLADPAEYARVRDLVDLDELQSYLIFQIYVANTDWPGNNIEYWRPRAEGGRWRWLMFGTDGSLGNRELPTEDTLAAALEPDGDGWPNPPWSTELLRLLLGSPEFHDAFVNRYADYLNTLLLPERTRELNRAFADEIADEIPRHLERWGSFTAGDTAYALEGGEWEASVAGIDAWLLERPAHARRHVLDAFGLEGTWTLTLEADPPGSGSFELSAVTVDAPFSGTYFLGVPVTITAVPLAGRTFAGWSDPALPSTPTVTVDPAAALRLVARFD